MNQPNEINLTCDDHQPISIPFKKFFVHSEIVSQQAWSGNIKRDVDYNNKYEYDSILQFSKACVDEEPKITPENVFGYYSLCDEWQVDSDVKKYALAFMQENAQKLLIKHILFQLSHEQDPSLEMNFLREDLPKYIEDPNLTQLPFDVLKKVVDFKIFEDDKESFQKVYAFCLKYLDEHKDIDNCSDLFYTLDVSKLSNEDLNRLKKEIPDIQEKIQNGCKQNIEKIEKFEQTKAKVPVYYPDWSSCSSKNYFSYIAEDDGWMCVQTGCNNYSNMATVTVAGKKKFVISGSNSSYTYSSVFFPIRKNQSVNCSTSSLTSSSSYFIKSKKDKVVILPDWANTELRLWSQEYTADCDGWVYADTGASSNTGYLKINNELHMFICRQDNGRQAYSSVFVPVSSGDKYYFYHASFPGVCYFIPGRKDYQIGMPDWEKEDSKDWETKYEANQKGWVYAQCQSYYCQNTSKEHTPGYLMVNGTAIMISQNNNSYYDNGSVFIPVAKGDKYNACGGFSNKSISFFPCLKEKI